MFMLVWGLMQCLFFQSHPEVTGLEDSYASNNAKLIFLMKENSSVPSK